MPLYDYECDRCGQIWEVVYKISEKPEAILCRCGGTAVSIISSLRDVQTLDDIQPYWDENLDVEPVLVKSRAHKRRLMAERGLLYKEVSEQKKKEVRQKAEYFRHERPREIGRERPVATGKIFSFGR